MAVIPRRLVRNEHGQAVTEYILMLMIVVMFYFIVATGLSKIGISALLMQPITGDFAHAYEYGSPKTKGFGENGGPSYHPRVTKPVGVNFRIFINKKQ